MSDTILSLFGGLEPCDAPIDLGAIPLYPSRLQRKPIWEVRDGDRWIRNVVEPALIPIMPETGDDPSMAVIVAPGGAFRALSVDNEGLAVGKWLAKQGIAAFVLIYRLIQTPRSTKAFYRSLSSLEEQIDAGAVDSGLVSAPPEALADSVAAVASVRDQVVGTEQKRAKVGIIGFSAGGILGISHGASDESSRPDFVGALYPSLDVIPVMPGPPPLFIAACCDDPLFGRQGFGIVEAWNEAGGDVSLHSYSQGGHGFGMKRQGLPCDEWPDRFVEWLRAIERQPE